MTILADDIKLVASRVMQDVPEGGGAPTATTIVDGASNAIFQDISELDRAGGDVSFRKMFIHVQTDNVDTYLGSNVIVAEPPADPNVSVTLFSTGEVFDERASASGRVESYLVPSSEWAGFLLENHVVGQRSVQLFQRPTEKAPDIGETIILVYNEGVPGERLQYVRVIDTSVIIRTYTNVQGKPFDAANVTCEISDPLRYDFPGTEPNEYFKRGATKTKVRETTVGDAAVYAGVAVTTEAVSIGDVAANVESVFTQLVPSAQTETPLIDQNAAGQSAAVTQSANGTISYTTSQPINSTTVLAVGNAITPGTLSIAVGTSATLTDTGGQVFDGATPIGTVDYGSGTVAFAALATAYNGTKTINFMPAAAPMRVADTAQIPVTQESRSFNYALTIIPTPAPGTVQVSYRSQGRWYDLRDNGGGVLRGADQSYGVGSINYATGTAAVTLGALPDDSTAIMYAWGSQVNYINRADMAVPSPAVRMQLEPNVTPSSVTVTWNDGTARTATDDGKGVITGSATGTVDYATGLVNLIPANLPAGGQEYSVAFSTADPADVKTHSEVNPVREADATVAFNLGEVNITPGTVELTWPIGLTGVWYHYHAKAPPSIRAADDGNGNIVVETGRVAGTINYATGDIVIQPDGPVVARIATYSWSGYDARITGYTYGDAPSEMPVVATIAATFQAGGTPVIGTPTVFVSSAVKFDITNRYGEQIVPNSVNFTLGGRRYFDRLGELYNQLDVMTGAATNAGTINYTTGEVVLSNWAPGQSSAIEVDALLTTTGDHTVSTATFRVPVSPVRPGSLQILATEAEGGTLNVTAGIDGTINGSGMLGTVDYETGVVEVRFGDMVTAAGNEDEPWYSADQVDDGGMIWKPGFVFAETIRFNAIAFSYLPLDAGVLGLDPVRLPQDGRVPIFRRGGFAVIGHTKTTPAATYSNGQTVDLARVRLSRVRVVGNDGATITGGYSADLEAGTITFNDVTGYSQPVTIEDRVEDMLQVSDVQISGRLAFTRQITHAYPAGSFMSSALIVNDLKARVSALFDQASWDGTSWDDVVSGSVASATYNNTLAPVVVTNRGAVTERWALKFTSTTAFQIIGEHVGVIGTGSINTVCAPINPATGTPYFTLSELGWGSGWAIGNVLRINTVGAMYPVWAVRTVQQGAESVQDDTFTILVRGDVDRP